MADLKHYVMVHRGERFHLKSYDDAIRFGEGCAVQGDSCLMFSFDLGLCGICDGFPNWKNPRRFAPRVEERLVNESQESLF